jgi:tetratricopeptide (TPR) repeat protein
VLMSAAHHALAHGDDEYCWHLAFALDTYLYRSGHHRDSILVHGWALQAAERLGKPLLQSVSHNFLGAAYTDRRRIGEALHHHKAALAICQEFGNEAQQAGCYINLAIVADLDGRPQDCIADNQRALELYRRVGEQVGQAVTLNNLGQQYGRMGEHEKAEELCRRSLDLWIELDDPHAQANCHDSLAYSAFHLGEHERAFEHFRRAVDGFRDLGDGLNQATSLARLGNAHAALHDDRAARAARSEALAVLQELDHLDAGELQAELRQSGRPRI